MNKVWDVVVVGGGAAGLSAALMLGRARRRVLVVDAGRPRNRFASHVHGVLGHEGLSPRELLGRGRAEAAGYGVAFSDASVERVEDVDGELLLTTDAETVRARTLVVATGITDDLPAIPGLVEQWGHGVLHCPYCHGWEVRNQHLGVLATSPLSLHQAELVRQWSDRVTLFATALPELDDKTSARLRSRGVALVSAPVAEVLSGDGRLVGVRTADGATHQLDALFTAGTPRPHDDFLAPLRLERRETAWGGFLSVDATGRTSHPRVWAAGNVIDPGANVAMAAGGGASVGAVVNHALVVEEFDGAEAAARSWPEVATTAFWEDRYAGTDAVWSGRVNRVLADIAGGLAPGTALDLGCGEGADVIWLARLGWQATGIDVSGTAVQRAADAARVAGLEARARFLVADAAELPGTESYDLITASFLHSSATATRQEILRRAAQQVTPGGHLLVISHAAPPPWAAGHAHGHRFLTAAEELAALALDPALWVVLVAETRVREATSPTGEPSALEDTVLLLRANPPG